MSRVTTGATRELQKPWDSFGQFTRAVAHAERAPEQMDLRLRADAAERVDPSIGYTIPAPFLADLTAVSPLDHPLLAGASTDRTTAFEYRGVLPDDGDQSASLYQGMTLPLTPDGEQITVSMLKWRGITMVLDLRGTVIPVTNEWLDDSPLGEAMIKKAAARALAFQDEDEQLNGTGVGTMLGIANAPALISVAIESGQSIANTPTYAAKNAANMLKQCRNPARSRFFVASDLYGSLVEAGLITNADADAPCGRLATRPIHPLQVAPAVGTVGDFLLADPSDYLIVSRGPMDYARSIHVRFLTDESLLRFTVYRNGQPITSGPVTPRYGSTKKSSYVALAARS